jgi:16S rRNA G966 N2-methylase RsmD
MPRPKELPDDHLVDASLFEEHPEDPVAEEVFEGVEKVLRFKGSGNAGLGNTTRRAQEVTSVETQAEGASTILISSSVRP